MPDAQDRKPLRIGILSASPGHIPSSLPTGQALEQAAGRNTGNLAFRYAVNLHVASDTRHVTWRADPGAVREQCDVLVIPSSNQANPGVDFSPRADFIEAVDLPCVPVGLGAQAAAYGSAVTFSPGTLRYLRALSERSRQIGVRGEYTAAVLARVGVRNTVVIGCPSNFINPLPALGTVIERKLDRRDMARLIVTAGDLSPAHQDLERKLFRWLLQRDGAYVCQSSLPMVGLARNREDEVAEAQVEEIGEYLAPGLPREQFAAVARQRFRVFFDAGAWLEFLAGFDLAIGPRIHGNLLAVQAGTPGICVYHDARTQELCETIALPHLSEQKLREARSPEDAAERAAFNGARFDQRRQGLARQYRRVLEESGVEVTDLLARLAGADQSREESVFHVPPALVGL